MSVSCSPFSVMGTRSNRILVRRDSGDTGAGATIALLGSRHHQSFSIPVLAITDTRSQVGRKSVTMRDYTPSPSIRHDAAHAKNFELVEYKASCASNPLARRTIHSYSTWIR